jgi:putative intracellular protease/amidase
MANQILMVLTSHDQLGDTGEKTGFWLEELAAPYYAFQDQGAGITLASPLGGHPPLDPKSAQKEFQTEATRRFLADAEAQSQLAQTVKLSEINATDFDAVFYPGGHGPLWDLVSDNNSITLIQDFWRQDKPVAAVCHAPIVLVNVKDSQGELLVKGREVTGFSNSEEEAVQLTTVVPQLVETTLMNRGGQYRKGEDWSSFTCQDGNLITGQNPASSEAAAQLVLQALG